jgi:hypothetical protein
MRYHSPSDLAKATPTPIAFCRFAHPTGYGVGDPARLVARQRRFVVYPDGAGASTSPRPPQSEKRRPPSNPFDLHLSHYLIPRDQSTESSQGRHVRLTSVADQAERRSRPRRRRALRTAWPARVDILCRKPCFRARFLLLGWKVRFISLSSSVLAWPDRHRSWPWARARQRHISEPDPWFRGRDEPDVAEDEMHCSEESGKNSSGCNNHHTRGG